MYGHIDGSVEKNATPGCILDPFYKFNATHKLHPLPGEGCNMQAIQVEVNYDFICPWCWIGQRNRLMQFAQSRDEPQETAALYRAIFAAYFSEGRDIGSLDTLVAIAAEHAFDAVEVRAYLLSAAGNQEIEAARARTDRLGVQAVPTLLIDGGVISGAQPPVVFANALRAAMQRSAA